ncbi:MAG: PASTA domain-containing protein [Pseudonocardiaceae bacterium]
MGDCPQCGYANPGAVDFCPNPECRAYLGWATAAAPPPPDDQQSPPPSPPPPAVEPPSVRQPPAQQRPAAAPPTGPAQKRDVRVTIEPTDLTVDPGGEVTTKVTVRNLGTRVEEFRLTPQGTAAPFASITPAAVSVYPDVEQRAVVRFAPPRGPHSPAGVATFEIVARSAIHADVSDVARGRLTITPFADLNAVLTPDVSRGRTPARHQVRLTNSGNTPVRTQVAFKGQDDELTFEPRDGTAVLEPGASTDLAVLVNGPRRWFGRITRLPFAAVITPTGSQPPITLNGTRQQTPVFAWWIPTAALAMVALAIALFAAWPKPTIPTVPVIAQLDQTAAVQKLKEAKYEPDLVMKGDDTIPPGRAIDTEPAGGSPLKRGERVKVNISNGKCPTGACPVEVPNVEGLSLTEAQAKLEDKKFTVRLTRENKEDVPVDRVISSDPKATTPRPSGSEVVLKVSLGPKESPPSQGGQALPVPLPVPLPGGAGAATPSPSPAPAASPPQSPAASPAQSPAASPAQSPAASPAASTSPAASPSTTPLPQIQLPDLTARSADEATKALTDLGLKAKTVIQDSNAVPNGHVLATKPAANSKVDPKSEVTLTVAQNTVDLIGTADRAAWTNGTGKALTFPGKEEDQIGFVRQRLSVGGITAKVLETNPQATGSITGKYQLAEPAVAGDRVRARVGLLKLQGVGGQVAQSAGGKVTFVIKAGGKDIQTVTADDDGTFKDIDADLSAAKGATSIEISVLADPSSAQQNWAPVWQNLRLEPQIG